MSWRVSPWIYPVWDSLCFLDLGDYFLSHIKEVFAYNFFKYFLSPFLFLFFFWNPYNSNVGMFSLVPGISEIVFNSFFFLILFIYLFIFGCVGSSLLCKGFLQLRRAGATLHHGARASHCRGLSCCGAQAPDAQAQ